MPKKKNKKNFFYGKVASHMLCPSFVYKLPHECGDITKNAWRTIISLLFGELSNIDYFFTFLGIVS